MPIDQSRWRLVLTDMNGSPAPWGAGQVFNASQKQFSNHLNSGTTMQFTIPIDNPASDFVMGHDALLKVYRRNSMGGWNSLMVGDVIHAEEAGQGDVGFVTVVSADPFWRIHRRLLGMGIDSIGRGTGWQFGDPNQLFDYSTLAQWVIYSLIFDYPIGLEVVNVQPCGSSAYLGPLYAQNAGDILQQITNTFGGPEVVIFPVEPSGTMPNTIIGKVSIAPAQGTNRVNTIFEYGTGSHNVATYDRILSKDGLCNRAYSPPRGFPDVSSNGDTMVMLEDTVSEAAIGLYEDVVQGDMVSIPLRFELVNEYVTVRKYARQQITFTPTVDCELDYTQDYNVGDTVQARAFVNGGYRYNGSVRIYGVDIAVDDNDAETPALTLIPSSA